MRPREGAHHTGRETFDLLLLLQALRHEGLALVAFFTSGLGVTGLHFVLLLFLFVGTQAVFHEGFALIALFAFSLFVAGGHFALLKVEHVRIQACLFRG